MDTDANPEFRHPTESDPACPGSSAEALPFVSIIVPVFNGAATIDRLITALLAQDYPASRFECLIADDCSTDDTAALVLDHAPRIRLLRGTRNSGSYAARNLAVSDSRGEVLAFTDADCAPASNWLSVGVAALQRQGDGLVAGAVVITPADPGSAVQRYDAAFGIQQELFAVRAGFGATANLLVSRTTMQMVGGFDATLRSGGDHRFCKDARRLGARFSYCGDCTVHHLPRLTFAELARKQIRVSAGLARIHKPWAQLGSIFIPLRAWRVRAFAPVVQLAKEGLSLQVRFRLVYYGLQVISFLTYSLNCLFLGRVKPTGQAAQR